MVIDSFAPTAESLESGPEFLLPDVHWVRIIREETALLWNDFIAISICIALRFEVRTGRLKLLVYFKICTLRNIPSSLEISHSGYLSFSSVLMKILRRKCHAFDELMAKSSRLHIESGHENCYTGRNVSTCDMYRTDFWIAPFSRCNTNGHVLSM